LGMWWGLLKGRIVLSSSSVAKDEVIKIAPGEVPPGVTPFAEELAREVMEGLESKTRVLLACSEPENMSLKQRQKTAIDIMVSLFANQKFIPRYVQWALDNPGKYGAQVVAVVPKTMEVEQTNLRERVIVVGQATEAEWQEAVKSLSGSPKGSLPWEDATDAEVIDG
jgi:hypothetical protein